MLRIALPVTLTFLLLAVSLCSAQDAPPGEPLRTVEQLIADLASNDAAKQIAAAETVVRRGAEVQAAVPALIAALESESAELREAACRALGAVGPPAATAIGPLIKRMNDEAPVGNTQVWYAAAEALGSIGEPAVAALIPLLDPAHDLPYRGAATALHNMGPAAVDALPRVLQILRGSDENIGPAVYVVEGIGPAAAEALEPLVKIMDHENFHYQYFACRAVASMGPAGTPAVEKLIELLRGPGRTASVRRHAAMALGAIGPAGGAAARRALIAALRDPIQPVRQDAIEALGKFGPDAREAMAELTRLMNDRRLSCRAAAAAALWRIDPAQREKAADVLLDELQQLDMPVEAARALGQVGGDDSLARRVTKLLEHEDPFIRENAADALGNMGPAAAIAVAKLQALAKDEKQATDLRAAAAEAIGRIDAAKRRAAEESDAR